MQALCLNINLSFQIPSSITVYESFFLKIVILTKIWYFERKALNNNLISPVLNRVYFWFHKVELNRLTNFGIHKIRYRMIKEILVDRMVVETCWLLDVRLFQITDCTVMFKCLKTKRLVCFDIFVFDFELDAYPDAYLKLVYN